MNVSHPSPRLAILGMAGAGLVGLGLLRVFPPDEYGWLPGCPIHAVSGIYCPGCGVARSLHALLTGDLRGAADLNLLLVVLLPLLIVWGVLLFARTVRDNRWQTPSFPRWMLVGILALVGLFTIARNLPVAWGRWFAP